MNDAAQIVIAASITILTIVLSLVGMQIIFLLRDFRKIIERIEGVLEDMNSLSSKLSNSLDSFGSTLLGLKTALSILDFFKNKKKKGKKEDEQ